MASPLLSLFWSWTAHFGMKWPSEWCVCTSEINAISITNLLHVTSNNSTAISVQTTLKTLAENAQENMWISRLNVTNLKHSILAHKMNQMVFEQCLLSFTLFQTHLTFFLQWNAKEDILKNAHAALLHTITTKKLLLSCLSCFPVKISKHSWIQIHLLEMQNDSRYEVLFSENWSKLSGFMLKTRK